MINEKLRILAIGAHPDDCEYHFGGTAAKYLLAGHIVRFVSMTNGNAGHQTLSRKELVAIRAEETRRVSALTSVEYEVLDNDDGNLTTNLETRDMLIAVIRRFKPDMIFTHRTNDYHTDHRHTGLLVQDASFLLGVPLACPEVPCLRYMPVILSFFDNFKKPLRFQIDIAVDISDTIALKALMLDCHRSQFYDWLPWVERMENQVPAEDADKLNWLTENVQSRDAAIAEQCLDKLKQRYGTERGEVVKYAEAFEISEYGAPLPEDKIANYFPF